MQLIVSYFNVFSRIIYNYSEHRSISLFFNGILYTSVKNKLWFLLITESRRFYFYWQNWNVNGIVIYMYVNDRRLPAIFISDDCFSITMLSWFFFWVFFFGIVFVFCYCFLFFVMNSFDRTHVANLKSVRFLKTKSGN